MTETVFQETDARAPVQRSVATIAQVELCRALMLAQRRVETACLHCKSNVTMVTK